MGRCGIDTPRHLHMDSSSYAVHARAGATETVRSIGRHLSCGDAEGYSPHYFESSFQGLKGKKPKVLDMGVFAVRNHRNECSLRLFHGAKGFKGNQPKVHRFGVFPVRNSRNGYSSLLFHPVSLRARSARSARAALLKSPSALLHDFLQLIPELFFFALLCFSSLLFFFFFFSSRLILFSRSSRSLPFSSRLFLCSSCHE